MTGHYILEGKIPVKVYSLIKWGEWFEKADRNVARDTFVIGSDASTVSTVFLGLDYNFGGGPPILFETMVFGGELDQEQERCSTWDQAEQMHKDMCAKVKRTFIKSA